MRSNPIDAPRTPHEWTTAATPTGKKRSCGRHFRQKVGRERLYNLCDSGFFACKLLMLESFPSRIGYRNHTSLATNHTSYYFRYTCSFFAVFGVAISIYLYLFEKKERKKGETRKHAKTPIHRLFVLPIFSSTGYDHLPPLIRGFPWVLKFMDINKLSAVQGGIHASTEKYAWGVP